MRLKLIIGLIFCFLGVVGVVVTNYAWNQTSEAKNDYRKITDDLETTQNEDVKGLLRKERDKAWNSWDTNQKLASLTSAITLIFAVLGIILIIVDVMKVKIPEEEVDDKENGEKTTGEDIDGKDAENVVEEDTEME